MSPTAQNMTIQLASGDKTPVDSIGKVITITSANPLDENSFETPLKVRIFISAALTVADIALFGEVYVIEFGCCRDGPRCCIQVVPQEAVLHEAGLHFLLFTPAYSVNVVLLTRPSGNANADRTVASSR